MPTEKSVRGLSRFPGATVLQPFALDLLVFDLVF